jgi:TonB family protein
VASDVGMIPHCELRCLGGAMRVPRASVVRVLAVLFLSLSSWPVAAQPGSEAVAWSAIADSQSAADFKDFVEAFPKGNFAKDARLKYSLLAQTTVPPRTVQIQVNYPKDAAALPFSVGAREVVLDVVVEADGKASQIKIARRSGFDPMDQAAVGAARRASYLPGVENGVAVRASMTLRINFGGVRCPGEYSLVSCKDGEFR